MKRRRLLDDWRLREGGVSNELVMMYLWYGKVEERNGLELADDGCDALNAQAMSGAVLYSLNRANLLEKYAPESKTARR